jgi:hypothetical protein
MEIIFKVFLFIHIISGTVGLISGTINMINKKGNKLHKQIGLFFFYGMLINGFSALVVACIHFNVFLFIVGIFSIYMVITAQRFLFLRGIHTGQKPKKGDWIVTYSMSLFGLFFMIYGGTLVAFSKNFGIVLLVFGIISLLMVKQDITIYSGNIKNTNYWLLIHIGRMIGAYIASITAFLVVNNTMLPSLVAWLAPGILLTPFIFYWINKYKGKAI